VASQLNSIQQIREQFPQLRSGDVYLDSAATTLKTKSVIDRMTKWMSEEVSNVHRGGHRLGNAATSSYEGSRTKVARFLNAKSSNEIVFTRGTTESINLVAASLSQSVFRPGDEIILSQLEHHSNIVPWQIWAERKGLKVKFVRITENGDLDWDHFLELLSPKAKMLSLTHQSNALGVKVNVKPFVKKAKEHGMLTLIDGAQALSSNFIDVQDLDCDFYVFSGHKIFGPTGIGVLYGKEDRLNALPPYQGGGSMIDQVTENGVSFLKAPQRFEAGTPAIAEAVVLGESIDFLNSLDLDFIKNHDQSLVLKATNAIEDLGFEVFGRNVPRSHVVSFQWKGLHPSDFASLLSEMNVAVRAGHHCCQPLMNRLGVVGTIRASFSVYSDENDLDQLISGLKKAKELLV